MEKLLKWCQHLFRVWTWDDWDRRYSSGCYIVFCGLKIISIVKKIMFYSQRSDSHWGLQTLEDGEDRGGRGRRKRNSLFMWGTEHLPSQINQLAHQVLDLSSSTCREFMFQGRTKQRKRGVQSSLEGCWVGSFVLSGNLISPKQKRILSPILLSAPIFMCRKTW